MTLVKLQFLPILVLVSLAGPPDIRAETPKQRLAVMDIQDLSEGLRDRTVTSLTGYLWGKLAQSDRYVLVDRTAQSEEKQRLLQDMRRPDLRIDKDFQIELGKAVGAESILVTTIDRIGSRYSVRSEVVDIEREVTTGSGGPRLCMADPPGTLEDRLLDALDKVVLDLGGRQTGKLHVTVEPSDGTSLTLIAPSGRTESATGFFMSDEIEIGVWSVRATHDGYAPFQESVVVRQGQQSSLHINLLRFGNLSVEGSPQGAEIRILGSENFERVGTLPLRNMDLPPGEYTLLVRAEGYTDVQQDITLAAEERKVVPIRLQSGTSGAPIDPPLEPPIPSDPGEAGPDEKTLALEAEVDRVLAIRVPKERQAALRKLVAENKDGTNREALIQAAIRVSHRVDANTMAGLLQETAFDPNSHYLIQEFFGLCQSDPRVREAFTNLLKRLGITKPPFPFPFPGGNPLPFPLPFPGAPGGGAPTQPPAPGTTPTFPFPIPDHLLPPSDSSSESLGLNND